MLNKIRTIADRDSCGSFPKQVALLVFVEISYRNNILPNFPIIVYYLLFMHMLKEIISVKIFQSIMRNFI